MEVNAMPSRTSEPTRSLDLIERRYDFHGLTKGRYLPYSILLQDVKSSEFNSQWREIVGWMTWRGFKHRRDFKLFLDELTRSKPLDINYIVGFRTKNAAVQFSGRWGKAQPDQEELRARRIVSDPKDDEFDHFLYVAPSKRRMLERKLEEIGRWCVENEVLLGRDWRVFHDSFTDDATGAIIYGFRDLSKAVLFKLRWLS
jgi:hypothetical protein